MTSLVSLFQRLTTLSGKCFLIANLNLPGTTQGHSSLVYSIHIVHFLKVKTEMPTLRKLSFMTTVAQTVKPDLGMKFQTLIVLINPR